LPDIFFGHFSSCLGTFLGNPKFLVHWRMMFFLILSTHVKEGGKPQNLFSLLTCFLYMHGLANFGSQVI
jgi:hypothetical protein